MKAVILCGGSGTRLWPISKPKSPKQFVKIFDHISLYEKTIERNKLSCDEFVVVVNEVQLDICKEQSKDSNCLFVVEPHARNTAPAIALAALNLDPDDIMLVVASDHIIKDINNYKQCLDKAEKLASKGFLVTFGLKPTYPETGYGYIESENEDVISFKEKPDLQTAKEYLDKGNYLWNSGMFCFKAATFLNELKKHSPQIFSAVQEVYNSKQSEGKTLRFSPELMLKVESDSIDFAIMEKSSLVKVVHSNFDWSDLGSYDSLYESLPKDIDGNTISDHHQGYDSKNNLIIANKKLITTCDVEGLYIIETPDEILVGRRGLSQNVKLLRERVKKTFPSHLE